MKVIKMDWSTNDRWWLIIIAARRFVFLNRVHRHALWTRRWWRNNLWIFLLLSMGMFQLDSSPYISRVLSFRSQQLPSLRSWNLKTCDNIQTSTSNGWKIVPCGSLDPRLMRVYTMYFRSHCMALYCMLFPSTKFKQGSRLSLRVIGHSRKSNHLYLHSWCSSVHCHVSMHIWVHSRFRYMIIKLSGHQ